MPAGDGSTIAEAEVWQLRLGGGMYEMWPLALGEHGTQLYGRVRSSTDPTRSSFEISVGENAMAVTPGEVVELIHELLDRASSGSR